MRQAVNLPAARFEKMVRRAGLDPWPKTFHAMRPSFETEPLERFPAQTVASWMGHSPKPIFDSWHGN